jgi:hypothetical protein
MQNMRMGEAAAVSSMFLPFFGVMIVLVTKYMLSEEEV